MKEYIEIMRICQDGKKVSLKRFRLNEGELSLDMFGLDEHVSTLTLVGDTKYTEPEMEKLRPFFRSLVTALTQQSFPIVVIDGATNFGVMKLFGEACEEKQPRALIGVTLRAAIEEEKMQLAPHHSHILLTPGRRGEWSTEVPFLEKVRSTLAGKKPSALLAVGGGVVTLLEMEQHAQKSVPLYVLLGSGSLPQGFIEAKKEFPDPAYPFSIEKHKSLLSTNLVNLLDLADMYRTVDTLVKSLMPEENCHESSQKL